MNENKNNAVRTDNFFIYVYGTSFRLQISNIVMKFYHNFQRKNYEIQTMDSIPACNLRWAKRSYALVPASLSISQAIKLVACAR